MAVKWFFIETGMGTDLHGQDSAKAARRAIQDALQRNSMLVSGMGDADKIRIEATVAVPKPEMVKVEDLVALFPVGRAQVKVVLGGLEFPRPHRPEDPLTVASAAIAAGIEE